MALPGFRRRVLIEPAAGCVRAELEDDWHRMSVTLAHDRGTITAVLAEMKRSPWSSCPGAIAQLGETFIGVALADVARRGEKTANCTHLYDLTLFAAAHAGGAAPTAYAIAVSDPVEGAVQATLLRDGVVVMDWRLVDGRIADPAELAGRRLTELGDWIAACNAPSREAARLLRWAAIMSLGRQMNIPTGSPATMFPPGACYTFQPDRAASALRAAQAWTDFSRQRTELLADRAAAFPQKSSDRLDD